MSLTKGALFHPSILSNVQILTVDNDRDSGILYAALFRSYGIAITTTESIKEALNLLNRFVPDILICETRFVDESPDLLIQQVRQIAQKSHKIIPVFVVSTYPISNLTEHLKVDVEAYQMKPINIDRFAKEVWDLILLPEITRPNQTANQQFNP